jgi:hypothetical protein
VGRSPYCSIVLSNPQSSRQHCALRLEGDTLNIADLNSANGTWVNDVRVTGPRKLDAGDVIRIGTDVLEVLPTPDGGDDRGRPTTHQRQQAAAAAGHEDRTQHMSFEEEASQTQTTSSQLELVEALVASASETRQPLALAPMIQRTIESLIQQHTHGGRRLPGGDVTLIAAVIEILAGWSPSQLGAWREQVLAALDRHTANSHHPRLDPPEQ